MALLGFVSMRTRFFPTHSGDSPGSDGPSGRLGAQSEQPVHHARSCPLALEFGDEYTDLCSGCHLCWGLGCTTSAFHISPSLWGGLGYSVDAHIGSMRTHARRRPAAAPGLDWTLGAGRTVGRNCRCSATGCKANSWTTGYTSCAGLVWVSRLMPAAASGVVSGSELCLGPLSLVRGLDLRRHRRFCSCSRQITLPSV